MTEGMRPDGAASSLDRIAATHERLIDRVAVPAWYWWTVAALTVGLGLVVDRGTPLAVGIGAPVFAVAVAGVTAWVILGGGRAQVGRDLLGDTGAIRIVGFVGLVVGASLAVGFALRAAGVPYPATIATVVAAIGLAAGGPLLMRSLRRTMLHHAAR